MEKRSKRSLSSAQNPSVKKAKALPVWEVPDLADAELDAFQTWLRGGLMQSEFKTAFWGNLDVHHVARSANGLPLWFEGTTLPVLDAIVMLEKKKIYLIEDVEMVSYSDEVFEENKERVQLEAEDFAHFLNNGWSFKFITPHVFWPSLARLLALFERAFRGYEHAHIQVEFSPSQSFGFKPASTEDHMFIIQAVRVWKQVADDEVAMIEESSEVIELKPGDSVYMPPNIVSQCSPDASSSNSVAIRVLIPRECTPADLAHSLVDYFTEWSPHDAVKVDDAMSAALKILTGAATREPDLRRDLALARKYSLLDFNSHAHISEIDLRDLLSRNNGFIRVENFLPTAVAKRIADVLCNINEKYWLPTEADQDYEHNNIAHSFHSAKDFPYADAILPLFRRLLPEQESTFSIARYTKGHFINPHDDNAFKEIDDVVYERDIAVIYYVTPPDWNSRVDGGVLRDLSQEPAVDYVPRFNSLVAFQVPRQHEVSEMLGQRPRYSIFGWFLRPYQVIDE